MYADNTVAAQSAGSALPAKPIDAIKLNRALSGGCNAHVSNPTAVCTPRITTAVMTLETNRREEFIDITDRVADLVNRWGIEDGMLVISSLHSTCSVVVNEFQAALESDMRAFLERIAPRDARWSHNDPAQSDCERMNGDAHLRALVLGTAIIVQVASGVVVLGPWQRILLAELDGPRTRRLSAQGWDLPSAP